MRHLATVVAGAYPLRRPPEAWSPGVLALRGPCYCAPLLPWQVQCPGCVSAALAAGQGGGGRRRFSLPPSSCLTPPLSRSPRCMLRVVPSGCPLPSPAGTLFNAFCAFRGLGLVALRSPPRVHCVCLRSYSRGVRTAHSLVGVACAPHAVPVQGAGRAVPRGSCPSTFPATVLCSPYPAQKGGLP